MLAKYCDLLLKKSVRTDNESDALLDQAVGLIYIDVLLKGLLGDSVQIPRGQRHIFKILHSTSEQTPY